MSGVAVGIGKTVGVMVDDAVAAKLFVPWNVTAVAVPVKLDNGVKVTTPVDVFTL